MKLYKSKRHKCLSDYLNDVRADRLDEWQMDEVISYVKNLEDGFNEVLYYFLCIENDVYISDEEIKEIRDKYSKQD